jgi:hypothetical protein
MRFFCAIELLNKKLILPKSYNEKIIIMTVLNGYQTRLTMKHFNIWVIFTAILVSCIWTVSAFSVNSVSIDSQGVLTTGTPVTLNYSVNTLGVFPSDHELQFYTDLDNPEWVYTVIVNGVENVRPSVYGHYLTLSGFELSYKSSDIISIRVTLQGEASSIPCTLFIKIQEIDGNGQMITSNIYQLYQHSSAFCVNSVVINPPGELTIGTPVTLTYTVNTLGVFPSDHDLQFSTDLDNPEWDYTVIVNGVENVRPSVYGHYLTLSGFELSYKSSDIISIRVILKGKTSSIPCPLLVKIQEIDDRGQANINNTFQLYQTLTDGVSKIGVFRNSTHLFYLDVNCNGAWNGASVDRQYNFGITGDFPISGDWNKDNKTEIGVFRNSTHLFYIDYDGNGAWNGTVTDRSYNFGLSGDIPITGDWNKDNKTEIGVFRNSTHLFYLDYNGDGAWNGASVDRQYNFGLSGDTPVSGDWNSDGRTEIGVFRNSTHLFYLDYNGNGAWNGAATDRQYNFGLSGDIPVTGDWNLDKKTEIGVFRNSTHLFYLDYNGNGAWNGASVDRQYNFGITGDKPVSGKWCYKSVVYAPVPTVTSISPRSGPSNGGPDAIVNVTITGSNFQNGATVKLVRAGYPIIQAIDVTVSSSTTINGILNVSSAENVIYNVIVTNPDGQSGELIGGFIVGEAAPIISSVTPDKGIYNETVNLIVTGQYFANPANVSLSRGTEQLTPSNILWKDATKITCDLTIPYGTTTGEWNVTVTNIADRQSKTWNHPFVVSVM